jgi:AcrR family transcriptional regulator
MSSTHAALKPASAERRGKPSHRDDLRAELLAEAVNVVEREGHEGLSIRKLAEAIGVSPAAPYNHFPDRRSLLLAVALEGYARMFNETDFVEGQAGLGTDRASEPLFQSFLAFIRFAMTQPHLFTLMYESELVRPTLAPELGEAQDRGFQLLRREIARLAPNLDEHQQSVRVATIWSAVFGFAMQANRAMLRHQAPEPAPDDLAPEVVRQALRLLAA